MKLMQYRKKLKNYFAKHPGLLSFIYFVIAGSILSITFYLRFPNNFIEPNFYAEDGSIFLMNIEQHGFLRAVFTTFNGYFISGLYLIEGLGYVINWIFQGSFLDLARSFAVASYLFLGFVCALPVILFRNYLKSPAIILILALSAFVPMPSSDYATIGTIGNLKFLFVYVAFLLLIYRNLVNEKDWKKFIVIDILLLICAYTNVVVYLLLPFAVIRYLKYIRADKKKLLSLSKLHSFQSLAVLGLLMIPQLVIIKLFGIPVTPGYLDTPYEYSSTINMFIYRSYLFPFLPHLAQHMDDIRTIFCFILLNVLLWFGLRHYRKIYVFGMATTLLITLLFTLNRTGISDLYKSYVGGGPDQFFYTQNLIICFLVGIAAITLIQRVPRQLYRYTLLIIVGLLLIGFYIPAAGSYGKNDFMQRTVKNVYLNAKNDCAAASGNPHIQLYPIDSDSFQLHDIPRAKICTESIKTYVPDTEYLELESHPGTYLPDIAADDPSQTFRSDYNGLSGISLVFLTYKQPVHDTYAVDIHDNTCTNKLRSITINPASIGDGASKRIDFTRIEDSKDKIYCIKFSLQSKKTAALAISLSKEKIYPEGTLRADNLQRDDDLILRLHYTK